MARRSFSLTSAGLGSSSYFVTFTAKKEEWDLPKVELPAYQARKFFNKNYEYNNKKAIINENNPVASAKANPKIA